MSKAKTLGWGFKLAGESLDHALGMYYGPDLALLSKTKNEVIADIEKARSKGDIPKTAKPKVFKVIAVIE